MKINTLSISSLVAIGLAAMLPAAVVEAAEVATTDGDRAATATDIAGQALDQVAGLPFCGAAWVDTVGGQDFDAAAWPVTAGGAEQNLVQPATENAH